MLHESPRKGSPVKKLLALLVAVGFALGTIGCSDTKPTKKAEKPAEKVGSEGKQPMKPGPDKEEPKKEEPKKEEPKKEEPKKEEPKKEEPKKKENGK
jgi:hypothetical protein